MYVYRYSSIAGIRFILEHRSTVQYEICKENDVKVQIFLSIKVPVLQ